MFTDGEFAPCPALNETPEYYKNNYNNCSYGKIGTCKCGICPLHSQLDMLQLLFFHCRSYNW